jgi:hypothetical protein
MNFKKEPTIWTPCGPVFAHNETSTFDGFYISYNHREHTTAICGSKRTFFLSLVGDHKKSMFNAASLGLDTLIDYYCQNIDKVSEHSECRYACGLLDSSSLDIQGAALSVFTRDQLNKIWDAHVNK